MSLPCQNRTEQLFIVNEVTVPGYSQIAYFFLFFFYLLLRRSISDHNLRSCGYVTCSRPQRTVTGGLEPGTSRPKVLGFTTALVRSTKVEIAIYCCVTAMGRSIEMPYTVTSYGNRGPSREAPLRGPRPRPVRTDAETSRSRWKPAICTKARNYAPPRLQQRAD